MINPLPGKLYLGRLESPASPAARLSRYLHDLMAIIWRDKATIRWRDKQFDKLMQEPRAQVVQIGAFDGQYHDPLSKFLKKNNVRALVIEPQAEPFVQLQYLYENKKLVKPLRAAVLDQAGKMTIYKAVMRNGDRFGIANGTTNLKQLKNVMKKHPLRRLRGYRIEKEVVTAQKLADILASNHVEPKSISIFICDAEGADTMIMNQFFKLNIKPKFIQYEHLHSPRQEVEAINQRLVSLGYVLRFSYTDVMASLKS